MFKNILGIILLVSCVSTAIGQRKKNLDIKANSEFYSGKIKLNTGDVIECELQYHYRSGVLYEKYSNKKTRPYSANTVVSFDFVDDNNEVRKFYSIPYRVMGKNGKYFFEVLFEKNNVAILSNYSLSYFGKKPGVLGVLSGTPQAYKKVKKSEIIYLVEGSNGIKPFLESTETDEILIARKNLRDKGKMSYQFVDESLIQEILGNKYNQVIEYTKKEKLKLKILNDLIRIMNFYADLK